MARYENNIDYYINDIPVENIGYDNNFLAQYALFSRREQVKKTIFKSIPTIEQTIKNMYKTVTFDKQGFIHNHYFNKKCILLISDDLNFALHCPDYTNIIALSRFDNDYELIRETPITRIVGVMSKPENHNNGMEIKELIVPVCSGDARVNMNNIVPIDAREYKSFKEFMFDTYLVTTNIYIDDLEHNGHNFDFNTLVISLENPNTHLDYDLNTGMLTIEKAEDTGSNYRIIKFSNKDLLIFNDLKSYTPSEFHMRCISHFKDTAPDYKIVYDNFRADRRYGRIEIYKDHDMSNQPTDIIIFDMRCELTLYVAEEVDEIPISVLINIFNYKNGYNNLL